MCETFKPGVHVLAFKFPEEVPCELYSCQLLLTLAHPRCETLTFADILKRFVAGVINIKHIGFILVALYQACQGYA